jgi:hypothetical protein
MADRPPNRYLQLIERIFLANYRESAREVAFTRQELIATASDLGIRLPSNIGDVVYSFRYRTDLPESVISKAPAGEEWIILPDGRGRYRFVATSFSTIVPTPGLAETKVPDATPGIIAMHAMSDEQALLAKLRYNRLIDIFTGVTCYSLQSHLRTTVRRMGQVETDEVYIGVDRRGAQYVFPVQAKAGSDRLSVVQIMQDVEVGAEKFPNLICRPIAAQFMTGDLIALFDFEATPSGIALETERHFRLVPPEQMTADDLAAYRQRPS